ncbi:MAG: KOW motif-containing protein [Planctomycetota bacterium]|nr:KOW motif-containing protein [Planctomycetota bacterium]MDA1214014.1 KOW motif-containing protein [Planctomycetota bacterium]
MNISSRTPEGLPQRCPICRNDVCISPSQPTGDAVCPHCGALLWFVVGEQGTYFYEKSRIDITGKREVAIGDHVRINGGPFESFEGIVKDINPVERKATIGVTLFGRESIVEINLPLVFSVHGAKN